MKNISIKITTLCNSFHQNKDNTITNNPNWDISKDARITIFSKCINVCNSSNLSFICLDNHMLKLDWWNDKFPHSPNRDDIQIFVNEFEMFTKLAFIQFLFSSIESGLRIYVKNLDPTACNNGTSEFKSIYSYLLNRIGLKNHETMLDLLRLIRNTIHNNGVYYHKSAKNESVIYKNTTYDFVIGQKIPFVTWDFLFEVCEDIPHFLFEVVNSVDIKQLPTVYDPFSL